MEYCHVALKSSDPAINSVRRSMSEHLRRLLSSATPNETCLPQEPTGMATNACRRGISICHSENELCECKRCTLAAGFAINRKNNYNQQNSRCYCLWFSLLDFDLCVTSTYTEASEPCRLLWRCIFLHVVCSTEVDLCRANYVRDQSFQVLTSLGSVLTSFPESWLCVPFVGPLWFFLYRALQWSDQNIRIHLNWTKIKCMARFLNKLKQLQFFGANYQL